MPGNGISGSKGLRILSGGSHFRKPLLQRFASSLSPLSVLLRKPDRPPPECSPPAAQTCRGLSGYRLPTGTGAAFWLDLRGFLGQAPTDVPPPLLLPLPYAESSHLSKRHRLRAQEVPGLGTTARLKNEGSSSDWWGPQSIKLHFVGWSEAQWLTVPTPHSPQAHLTSQPRVLYFHWTQRS